MNEQEKYVAALAELFGGLERQGPGDSRFSRDLISKLPDLPNNPRIADIGCGAGAGTLVLAEQFQSIVKAVDFTQSFLDELDVRAEQKGLGALVGVRS